MGRGRAKAKQTKVARELKYRSIDTDFSSLERELRGSDYGHHVPSSYQQDYRSDEYDDVAARYNTDDDDDDDPYAPDEPATAWDPYDDLRKSG